MIRIDSAFSALTAGRTASDENLNLSAGVTEPPSAQALIRIARLSEKDVASAGPSHLHEQSLSSCQPGIEEAHLPLIQADSCNNEAPVAEIAQPDHMELQDQDVASARDVAPPPFGLEDVLSTVCFSQQKDSLFDGCCSR